MPLDLHFKFSTQNENGTTYSRRMHGLERMTAAISEHVDGFGHIFIGAHAEFKADISRLSLLNSVKVAWIKTRFMVPWIALQTSALEDSQPNSYSFSYEASSTQDVAAAWADKTVNWRQGVRLLPAWEVLLKDEYWKPSDGRFASEVHLAVAPTGGFFIMFSVAHWLADGRGILPAVNLFFESLQAETQGCLEPISSLAWGEEVQRLSPATVRAIETPHENPEGPPRAPEPPSAEKSATPIQFLPPLVESQEWLGHPSLHQSIVLSQAETSAFHAICRSHGRLITSALNSILIIADIETALHVAPDSVKFAEVAQALSQADVYPVFTNVVDRRPFLSPRWPSVTAPGGFGGIVNDNFVTFHDMNLIRKCIRVGSNGQVIKNFGKREFWDGFVAETQSLVKANIQSTPEVFFATQNAVDSAVPQFDPASVLIPGVMSSSIGKLERLGLFNNFRPAVSASTPSSTFALRDLLLAVRATGVTAVVSMMWEYDGRLNIHLQGSPRWHSDEAWAFFGTAVKQAIVKILAADHTFVEHKL